MIKGFDLNDNTCIFAQDVDKSLKHEYICPCCKDKLIVKQGEVLSHHFAHQKENEINKGCILKTTSSDYDDWVYAILTSFRPSEVEVNKDNQVFDILLENDKSVTLCYIEHLMKDKGVIPILDLEHKQNRYVTEWNVLLNMSDEFELIELRNNKLLWKDRFKIKYTMLTNDITKLKLWIYYNDTFYRINKFEKEDVFMKNMYFNKKVNGIENFRKELLVD